MKDFLKNNIEQRRDEFDLYDTGLVQVWDEIEKKLDGGGKNIKVDRNWWRLGLQIAAAILLATCCSLLFYWRTIGSVEQPTLSMVSPEMAETEQYYAMKISEKMTEIEQSGKLDPALLGDLKVLDQAYSELRADLGDNLDNAEVIDAMIISYKIKLEVLDRVLRQIKEVNNEVEIERSTL